MHRCLFFLLSMPILMGCGTTANMKGSNMAIMGGGEIEPWPFGGVANDLRWVGGIAKSCINPEDFESIPIGLTLGCYYGLIDLPLSLVGDVITLPFIILNKKHINLYDKGRINTGNKKQTPSPQLYEADSFLIRLKMRNIPNCIVHDTVVRSVENGESHEGM